MRLNQKILLSRALLALALLSLSATAQTPSYTGAVR